MTQFYYTSWIWTQWLDWVLNISLTNSYVILKYFSFSHSSLTTPREIVQEVLEDSKLLQTGRGVACYDCSSIQTELITKTVALQLLCGFKIYLNSLYTVTLLKTPSNNTALSILQIHIKVGLSSPFYNFRRHALRLFLRQHNHFGKWIRFCQKRNLKRSAGFQRQNLSLLPHCLHWFFPRPSSFSSDGLNQSSRLHEYWRIE